MEDYSWNSIKNYLKARDWKWLTKGICFIAIVTLVLTDQMVKWAVRNNLHEGDTYHFISGVIDLKYIVNHGSAFSFFQNQTAFLMSFAFIITFLALIWFLFAKSITRTLGISFVIAGTLGNLIDRFLHNGGVVDFLSWRLFPPYTIFNTADIFITIGIIIIILHMFIDIIYTSYQEKKGEKITNEKPQPPAKTSNSDSRKSAKNHQPKISKVNCDQDW